MTKVLDCSLKVSEFQLHLHYYIHFCTNTLGKGMNPFIPLAMSRIVSLLFFYKDGFGIKGLTKIYMPLNKETKELEKDKMGLVEYCTYPKKEEDFKLVLWQLTQEKVKRKKADHQYRQYQKKKKKKILDCIHLVK